MKLPQIRQRLYELALELREPELNDLADQMARRKSVRAPRHSMPMSVDMRAKIKALHKAEPDLPLNRIAAALDINPGRVSETLRGFRQ